MSLLVDRRGNLWAGTFASGLHRLAPGGSPLRARSDTTRPTPRSLSGNGVTCLLEARDGTLWAGTYGGGLNRFDAARRRLRALRPRPGAAGQPRQRRRHRARRGRRRHAVGRHAARRPRRARPAHRARAALPPRRQGSRRASPSTPSSRCRSTSGARSGLGTDGGGLDRWERADRAAGRVAFRHYTRARGPAEQRRLRRAVRRARLRLGQHEPRPVPARRRRTARCARTTPATGCRATSSTTARPYAARNGEMFFGGTNGFVSFLPDALRSNEHVPPVVLTAVSKLNRPVAFDAAAHRGRARWRSAGATTCSPSSSPRSTTARPRRTATPTSSTASTATGSTPGTLRRATYTNVSPGRYTFRVRAANDDGVWNEKGLALRGAGGAAAVAHAVGLRRATLLAAGAALFALVRVQRRRLRREEEYSRRLEREVAAAHERAGREQPRAAGGQPPARGGQPDRLADRAAQPPLPADGDRRRPGARRAPARAPAGDGRSRRPTCS